MYCHNKFGFTLIEVLLVLTLLTIILCLSVLVVLKTKFIALHDARSQVVSLLALARSDAVQGYEGRMIGVKIEAGNLMLVSALPTATSTTEQVLQTDSETLATITTNPNEITVWFYPASGRASNPGEIILSNTNSLASTSIYILYEGVIQ
jgi:prepilin-type N-terminal cleavage/methylation domain-containing protein